MPATAAFQWQGNNDDQKAVTASPQNGTPRRPLTHQQAAHAHRPPPVVHIPNRHCRAHRLPPLWPKNAAWSPEDPPLVRGRRPTPPLVWATANPSPPAAPPHERVSTARALPRCAPGQRCRVAVVVARVGVARLRLVVTAFRTPSLGVATRRLFLRFS